MVSRLPVTQWYTTVFPAAPVSMPLMVQSEGRPKVIKVRDEQRAAIAACVVTPTGPLTIVTAHLSFVPGYNVRQLRRIKKWFADLPGPWCLLVISTCRQAFRARDAHDSADSRANVPQLPATNPVRPHLGRRVQLPTIICGWRNGKGLAATGQ